MQKTNLSLVPFYYRRWERQWQMLTKSKRRIFLISNQRHTSRKSQNVKQYIIFAFRKRTCRVFPCYFHKWERHWQMLMKSKSIILLISNCIKFIRHFIGLCYHLITVDFFHSVRKCFLAIAYSWSTSSLLLWASATPMSSISFSTRSLDLSPFSILTTLFSLTSTHLFDSSDSRRTSASSSFAMISGWRLDSCL